MKLKLLLLISILQLSLDSQSQIFNKDIRFGMQQETADSILSKIKLPSSIKIDWLNINIIYMDLAGTQVKASLEYNDGFGLLYRGPIREINYEFFKDREDLIKRNSLTITNDQKQQLEEQYKGRIFYFDDEFDISMVPSSVIDTLFFNEIKNYIIAQGYFLDSVRVIKILKDNNCQYFFSKNNNLIILSRDSQLFKPNCLYNFWHYLYPKIEERSPHYQKMLKNEQKANLLNLNKDNIFDPINLETSYDTTIKSTVKEIIIKTNFKLFTRRCYQYKPEGISYIEGGFEIKDVFGKVLQTFNGFQFNVKECMPSIENFQKKSNCPIFENKFTPDESWNSELLNHLANNYDIEVTFKVSKIRFETGEIWE